MSLVPTRKGQGSRTDRQTLAEPSRAEAATGQPRLIVVSGMLLGVQVELADEPIVVGRSSECTLSMPHPSVSRQHCRIWREGAGFMIEDLGSTNRTYLNGKPVQRARLHDGDQISVGNNAIKFFVGSSVEANYHEELIDLAIYDSLTGFFNRRHFRSLLDEDVERLRKAAGREPLCLLMADLDHFKQINDAHGHMVGDQVLSGVAQLIRECVPPSAAVGRLGGEEFAVALRGAGLDEALALAQVLRARVQDNPVAAREHSVVVTLSIGVTQAQAGDLSGSDLLRRADEQLYQAKEAGRNCVRG